MLSERGEALDSSSSIKTGHLLVVVPARIDSSFDEQFQQDIQSNDVSLVTFELAEGQAWSGSTLAAIRSLERRAIEQGKSVSLAHLPERVARVLAIARDATQPSRSENKAVATDFLTRVGETTLNTARSAENARQFLGEVGQSFRRLIAGQANFQKSDLVQFMRDTGPKAIPLVGLVNLLLGVILAFMGAIQLQQFGAQIFVADLVAIGLTREIAPMMTAIILAGRTGAAYAAQLGTMQVNEEIDAFTTFGFSPIDFLVLPRMLALALMTPLLVLYADAIGIIGGFLVGVLLLDIGAAEYIAETRNAIGLGDIFIGVFKASIFGMLVAVAGCLKGMQSGRNASAVGQAATSAVVSGIVAIIVATAIFAVLTNALGL